MLENSFASITATTGLPSGEQSQGKTKKSVRVSLTITVWVVGQYLTCVQTIRRTYVDFFFNTYYKMSLYSFSKMLISHTEIKVQVVQSRYVILLR